MTECTTIDSNQQQKSKTTIRVAHNRENPFVMINRSALRHPKLTLKARGLWAYLLSFPDDWEFNMAHLVNTLPEGRTAIYNAFDELIEHGYVIRLQYHGSKAHNTVGFQKLQYIIFEFPSTPEERELKYSEFEKHCIHSGQIKINSVHSGFVNTGSVNAGNQPLRNSDSEYENEDKNINAPPEGDAKPKPSSLSDAKKKTPKVPFRSACLKERLPDHPATEKFKNYFDTPLIGIDDRDHEELVAQYGAKLVSDAYEFLADWKLSKAEVSPKTVKEHTDLRRLKKWVFAELLKNPQKMTGVGSHRKWAIEIDKKPLDPVEKRRYAWGTKTEKREEELLDYLKKVHKKEGRLLGKMSNAQVDELEAEMLQYLEKQGDGNELGSL